jgi:hypothetical protein
MKKVIVFRVENVLVKDFNKEDSYRRIMVIETNRLRRNAGSEEVEKDLEKIESEKRKWVERREKEFYDKEFERSKFKNGVGEIMKVLYDMKGRMGLEMVFVSKYRKGKIESVLWGNGLREVDVENCSGDWVGRVLERSGKEVEDVVMFSNDLNDMERREEWGIKVERLNAEKEGIEGVMGKLGLRRSA